ncbi:MAG: hypothetical protein ABIJ81_01785 [Patescibacteria group bacterium]
MIFNILLITVIIGAISVITYLFVRYLRKLEDKMDDKFIAPLETGKRILWLNRVWISFILVLFMLFWFDTIERMYLVTPSSGTFLHIFSMLNITFRVIGMYVVAFGISTMLLKCFFPKLSSKCPRYIFSQEFHDDYRFRILHYDIKSVVLRK